jgi:hypothetical protein
LSLVLTVSALAEDLTLPANVIMRSDHSLTSVKAGSIVEVLSRDEKTITIRYNGQTGTIPTSSLVPVSPTPTEAASPTPKPARVAGAAPFITIGATRFYRVYAPAESPIQLREYLPSGESIEHWSHLASVRIFKDINNPGLYLQNVAAGVAKSNPAARSRLLQNNQTHELLLDFMMFAPAGSAQAYAEWNLMRARFVEGKGLVVYQYAVRYYTFGADTGAKVNAERISMMEPFGSAVFEEE